MKNKKQKTPKLPKYELGNIHEDAHSNAQSGTQNIYNQGRQSKISSSQYTQAGTAIAAGGVQAFQGYNNPYANDLEKTRSVQAGADTAKIGVATAINPLLGAGVGAVTKIGSGVQDNVDRTDANGNIINRNDSKMGEIAGGFLSPSNSLIGIYTDPNATTGQKIAGALTGGLSDMFTNRHRNQVESNAKANLNQNQFAFGGTNMQPNAEVEKQENTLNPDGSTTQFDGPSHEQGGIPTNLEKGTMIFSDKLKHNGKTFAQLNKTNMTHKEDKILDDKKASAISKRTAELMKFVKNKNSEILFNEQESLKQAKVEAYAKKMGVTMGDNKFHNGGTMRSEQESKLNDYSSELYQNWMASRANLSGKRMGPDVQTPGIKLINQFLSDPRTSKLSDEQYMKISEGLLNGVHQLRKSGEPMRHEDFTEVPEQKFPMGGVKLPMYPYGGDGGPVDTLGTKVDAPPANYNFYKNVGNKQVYVDPGFIRRAPGSNSKSDPDNWNKYLIGQLQNGVSPDELANKGYGTKEGLNPLAKYYKPKYAYVEPLGKELDSKSTQPYAGTRSGETLLPKNSANQDWNTYSFADLNGQTNKSVQRHFDNSGNEITFDDKYNKVPTGKNLDYYRGQNVRSDAQGSTMLPSSVTNINSTITNDPNKFNTKGSGTSGGFRYGGVQEFKRGGKFKAPVAQYNPEDDVVVPGNYNRSNTDFSGVLAPSPYDKQMDITDANTLNKSAWEADYMNNPNASRPSSDNPTQANGINWKGLGTQAAYFAANNAGNIYDLARSNKTETRKYDRATANLITPDFRQSNQTYAWAKKAIANTSGGNAATALNNIQGAHVNHVLNNAQIQQAADNANAGIKNQVSQFNTGISMDEKIANAKISANARNIKQGSLASMGSNTANQMNDIRNTDMDKKKMDGLIKMYPSLSKDPKMLEYFMSFSA